VRAWVHGLDYQRICGGFDAMNSEIKSHTERCIELYGMPIDCEMSEQIRRESYEQIRADLMIALGMLMALNTGSKP
jgi:hypothetical protein